MRSVIGAEWSSIRGGLHQVPCLMAEQRIEQSSGARDFTPQTHCRMERPKRSHSSTATPLVTRYSLKGPHGQTHTRRLRGSTSREAHSHSVHRGGRAQGAQEPPVGGSGGVCRLRKVRGERLHYCDQTHSTDELHREVVLDDLDPRPHTEITP